MSILIVLIILFILIGGGVWGWPLLAGMLGLSSVTDKAGALRHIRQLIQTYEITASEIETVLDATHENSFERTPRGKNDVAKTLFTYLGAIFILAGVGTYIGMFWDSMSSVMRISITLGVGYILFIVLISALYEKKYPRAILPLTFASVFMMVVGWVVFFEELYPNADNWRATSLFICACLAVHWGALFSKYQGTAFAFITLSFTYGFMQIGFDMLGIPQAYIAIVLGSSLFLVGTALIKTTKRVLAEPALLIGAVWLNGGLFDLVAKLHNAEWASVVVGVCAMITAYGLHREDRYPRLIGLGYLVGSVMLYVGLFEVVENTPIELVYLAVTASLLYLCVVLQSRALLFTTVLAMLSYIGYFSATHFVDSLGWPATLVLTGIAFLGVGTIAFRVKRRL